MNAKELNKRKNKGKVINPFDFKISADMEVPFKKLGELYGELGNAKIQILGFYVNEKGKYGPSAVAYNQDYQISLPNNAVEDVRKNIDDEEFIKYVNDGNCYIIIKPYNTQRFGVCYDYEFADER